MCRGTDLKKQGVLRREKNASRVGGEFDTFQDRSSGCIGGQGENSDEKKR